MRNLWSSGNGFGTEKQKVWDRTPEDLGPRSNGFGTKKQRVWGPSGKGFVAVGFDPDGNGTRRSADKQTERRDA